MKCGTALCIEHLTFERVLLSPVHFETAGCFAREGYHFTVLLKGNLPVSFEGDRKVFLKEALDGITLSGAGTR